MRNMIHFAGAAILLLSIPGSDAAPPESAPLQRFRYVEPHMGTTFQIVLYAADQAEADRAAKAGFARVVELDRVMSDYKPQSELMQLCQRAGGGPTPVSEELFFVLSKGQEVSRLADGAFDVTVGPLSKLWRKARKIHQLPDAAELAAARKLVDYRNVQLDAKTRTVKLLQPGMQLDLGGIAKGYTADEVLKVLATHGITRALVAAGGDVAVGDPPPDQPGWKVGLAPLENPNEAPKSHLLLKRAAVSTSGEAEQYVEVDGQRYSHIVDPRTGIGLKGRMSVTVVAPTGIQADSLTKVVAVLGPEKGLPILDNIPGVACRIIRATEAGPAIVASKRWADVPMESPR